MNSFKFCLFLFAISFLALSCQKDKVDPIPEPVLDEGILLEIKEGENFYIDETGNHFYSNRISKKNDSTLYRLKIKTGVKYHFYCLKPDLQASTLKIFLLNSKREIISESTNKNGKVEIFFTPSVDENLYLEVTIPFDVIKPIEYNLYFEKLTPANLSFVGYNWETSGNWKVIDSKTVEFTGSNTGEFRWIRLKSTIPEHMDLSFTMKSAMNTGFPSFGIILNGSAELLPFREHKDELPQRGHFFNIYDPFKYQILHFDRTSISYEHGTLNIPNMDVESGINFTLGHANPTIKTLTVNNILFRSYSKTSWTWLYLVVEDKSFDKVRFENVTWKEDQLNHDYEGTWSTLRTMNSSIWGKDCREVMIFNANHFEDALQEYDAENNKWINFLVAKGTLTMHNNLMNVHISEVCVSEKDYFSLRYTGVLKCDKEDFYEFEYNLPQFWNRKDFILGYSVSGNGMNVRFDKNNNGNYTDEGEAVEFTRE